VKLTRSFRLVLLVLLSPLARASAATDVDAGIQSATPTTAAPSLPDAGPPDGSSDAGVDAGADHSPDAVGPSPSPDQPSSGLDSGVVVGFDGDAGVAAEVPKKKPLPKNFVGIVGRVTDAQTGEGLIEATVKVVAGGKKSALTDVDGDYRLKLPPGQYDLRVFYALYEGRRVQGVEVKAGQVTTLDVALEAKSTAIKEVVVEAKADKRNETALLQERKKAAAVQDSVGAQEMARTPDANAGEAAKRVVGVTLVGGKYVFVRGLGGRYVQTLLNGTLMPSPEPDEPGVPLDLFPTSLVSNLNVLKTYTPDLPAQFGGGSLTVDTATFPTQLEVKVRVGGGGDSATTFQARPSAPSSLGEAFGFRDPSRDLPSVFPADRPFQQSVDPTRPGVTAETQQAGGRALPNRWTPGSVSASPNGTVGAQVGDTLKLGGERRLGYLFAAQWARKERTRRIFVADVSGSEGGLEVENPTDSLISSVNASTSALGNVGFQLDRDNEVNLLVLGLTNAENQAVTAAGPETLSAMQDQVNNRLQFTQRQLLFSQLKGFHRLNALADLELEWQGNYGRVQRSEPDIRDSRYFVSPDTRELNLRLQPNSAERFFLGLAEDSGGGSASATLPWRAFRFKAGGFGQYQARRFDGRRFRFFELRRPTPTGLAEDVLTSDRIGPGADTRFFLAESTLAQDSYTSTLALFGGFGLVEWKAADWLRVQAGVRYEGSRQSVAVFSPFATDANARDPVVREYHSPVPSLNVTVSPLPTLNLRAAYASTVARPSFRELAPFIFFDMVRRRNVAGNPDLLLTTIHHADLRAEWFPTDTEVFSVSLFGKQFIRPIERVVIGQGSNFDFGFRNADGAQLAGVELEARTSLGRLTPALKDVRLGGNTSFIWSRVQLANTQGQLGNPNRPLQGQAPWAVNAFITWAKPEWGSELGVFYNVSGPEISEVAVAPLPDFVTQPVHKLDVTWSQSFGPGFQLKVGVANALDQRLRIQQANVEVFREQLGVQFNASLAWTMPTTRK
jgi:outer membrane receptor protein involved in Fe transport